MKKKLVILSVPFQRISRVLLSPTVLEVIKKNHELIIVSPFTTNINFIKDYAAVNTTLISCPPLNKPTKLVSILYEVSEILRMNGHWRKFRYKDTGYQHEIKNVKIGRNGADTKYSFVYRTVFTLLSFIGSYSKSWKIIDWLLSDIIYKFDELLTLADQYEDVTFIQAASWGDQDRMLANFAGKTDLLDVSKIIGVDIFECNDTVLTLLKFSLIYRISKFNE